jgi:adenosylcobinamide kinase/adenosylcobinamide-phosphate guanylyltransferase
VLIFISGGVRSGKSTLGEQFANELSTGRMIYLATAKPYDEEMEFRIEKHQKSREKKNFITIEKSENISEIVFQKEDTVLLDCLGTLTSNEMFYDYSLDFNDEFAKKITDKIFNDIIKINLMVKNLIIISNEIFSDGKTYDKATGKYLEVLGKLHIKIAEISHTAIECAYGFHIFHKGEAT